MMKTTIKKIAALLLALTVMIPVGVIGVFADEAETPKPIVPNPTWGANDEGVFEIATPEDLYALASKRVANANYKDKTVVLTADIDVNPGWDASTKTEPTNLWASMFNFFGTLDGQGHTIRGLYCNKGATGENASFATIGKDTVIKNLRVENSYFYGAHNSGFFACARGSVKFENVYIDVIAEAVNGNAGGFVSWFFTSEASSPRLECVNCVFAGSVSAAIPTDSERIPNAGGFLATNAKSDAKGQGDYEVVLTDCANYGTVSSSDSSKAAGLVGSVVNKATLTRCFHAGTASTALLNVNQTEAKDVVVEDCYYVASADVKAMTKTEGATSVTLKYDGEAATEFKTATSTELLEKAPFKANGEYKGWVLAGGQAVPAYFAAKDCEHDYETVITPPTCTERGYTTYTCKKCGNSYKGDFVDMIEHTEGEWQVVKEATEDRAGSRQKVCTVCGKVLKTEIIPKLAPATTEGTTTTEVPGTTTTEAPATTTTEPATTTAASGSEKAGCGSSIALSSALGALLLIGTATVACKKRK